MLRIVLLKLGIWYLGESYDAARSTASEEAVRKTHGVEAAVTAAEGMGSGACLAHNLAIYVQ